jgi:hypothetical protein
MVRRRGEEVSFSGHMIGKGVIKSSNHIVRRRHEKSFTELLVRRRGDEKCWQVG